jgi:putative phosphoribosyl transferase
MGAIASGGLVVMNRQLVRQLGIAAADVRRVTAAERRELARREALYRGDRPPAALAGRTVILVDDGLATGASMRAAARVVRQARPARIVVAVPVAAQETCEALRDEVDEVVCGVTPEPFMAVGYWYGDFSQTSDEEVRALLEETADRAAQAGALRTATQGIAR